jgi:hypothetical protein
VNRRGSASGHQIEASPNARQEILPGQIDVPRTLVDDEGFLARDAARAYVPNDMRFPPVDLPDVEMMVPELESRHVRAEALLTVAEPGVWAELWNIDYGLIHPWQPSVSPSPPRP